MCDWISRINKVLLVVILLSAQLDTEEAYRRHQLETKNVAMYTKLSFWVSHFHMDISRALSARTDDVCALIQILYDPFSLLNSMLSTSLSRATSVTLKEEILYNVLRLGF